MDFGTFALAFIVGFITSTFMLAGGMSMKIAQAEREAWQAAIVTFLEFKKNHDEWHANNPASGMPDLSGPKRKAH